MLPKTTSKEKRKFSSLNGKLLFLLLLCCASMAAGLNWLCLTLVGKANQKADAAAGRSAIFAAKQTAYHAGELLQDDAHNALNANPAQGPAPAAPKTARETKLPAGNIITEQWRGDADHVVILDAEGSLPAKYNASLPQEISAFMAQSPDMRRTLLNGARGFFTAGGSTFAVGTSMAMPEVETSSRAVAAGIRKMSAEDLQHMGLYTVEPVRLIPFTELDKYPEQKNIAGQLQKGQIITRRMPDRKLAAYTLFEDITGRPFALLMVETARPEAAGWLLETRWAVGTFAALLSLFIGAVLTYFLQKKVFRRLRVLRDFALRAGTDLSIRAPLSGNDEITEVSMSLNGLVQALERDIKARSNAEGELIRHEREYRALFESVPDAILLVDASTGRIVNANPAARALYGYAKDELLNLTSNDIAADHSDLAEITLDWTRRSPSNYHRKKDGSVFPVEISMSFSTQRWGKCCIMAVRDISRRKKAENIATAQHRLSLSLSAAKTLDEAAAIILDETLRAGKVVAALLLRRNSDGTYTLVHKRGDETALEQTEKILQIANGAESLEKGHTATFDRFHPVVKNARLDMGATGALTLCAVPISSGFKTVGALMCLFKTEVMNGDSALRMLEAFAAQAAALYDRLAAVSELEANRHNLQNLFDSMQDMIFICDLSGRMIYSNKAAKNTFPPPQDLQERNFADLHLPAQREELLSTLAKAAEGPLLFSSELRKPDGKLLSVEIQFSRGRWEGSDAVFAIARDLTERKSAEQMRDDVERAMRHDLKSPLTNLISIPEVMLSMPNVPEDQKDWWRSVLNNARRMLDMINSSLDIYKLETGTYRVRAERIDLAPALTHMATEMEPLTRLQDLKLELNLPPQEAPIAVHTDKILLIRMLGNLLRNAVEASARSGKVKISLALREDGQAQVTLHNSGAIPEQMRGKIFQKYASFGKMTGTGLGTYSAKLIADAIGAEIIFETSEEKGTDMKVSLPVAPGV